MAEQCLAGGRRVPSRLYKFQAFSEFSLLALSNHSLRFSSPLDFNDPFDCRYRVAVGMADRGMSTETEQLYLEAMDQLGDFPAQRSVACFSENLDNLLLWSHYANGHRGFCLEFDTTLPPFDQARRIVYSDSFPAVDVSSVQRLRQGGGESLWDDFVLLKSTAWSYEAEWRIVRRESAHSETFPPNALTGVYFGCYQSFDRQKLLAGIVGEHSRPRFYRMKRTQDSYALYATEFNKPAIDEFARDFVTK